jgi:hypothetical protein
VVQAEILRLERKSLRMHMRRPVLLLTLALLATACSQTSTPGPATTNTPGKVSSPVVTATAEHRLPETPAVPQEYQALYASLEESLESFHDYLSEHWDGTTGSTVFAAELLVANGNRGDVLLQPATMVGVNLYLDRFQELGVQGVTVAISFPLLSPDFPRSAEYLRFFQGVAEEVHRRGLKLLVESGPVFPDPEYSRLQVDFSGFTTETFFQAKREQLLLIAREVRPDYLSISGEPTTEKMLTGLSLSPAEYAAFAQETADAIDRSSGILVGAGAGTWEDPEYIRGFVADTSLDFINMHVYPLKSPYDDYLQRAVETAELARASGKKLVIGESWLYKASPAEVGKPYQEIFPRDVFSFWEPLDIRFIEAMAGLAHYQGFEYVSLFWANYLFAYLDYDETSKNLSYVELMNLANQAASDSILAGTFSGTGQALQRLLSTSSKH